MRETDRRTWLEFDVLPDSEQRALDEMVERDLGRRLKAVWTGEGRQLKEDRREESGAEQRSRPQQRR